MDSERKSSDKQNEGERRGPNPSRREIKKEIRVDSVWHPLSFGRPPLFGGHQ